jgi:SAM-dependent methyltransferase
MSQTESVEIIKTVEEARTGEQVRDFFHSVASEFDSIYSHKTNPIMALLNKWLRKDIYQRYEMTIEECAPRIAGQRILDIGCGTGRYCHELAKRGAKQCDGIDFAQKMLDLANDFAKQRAVEDHCRFILANYLDYPVEQPYDVSISMGYFDYVSDPLTHLRKMRADSKKMITIFPVKGTVRARVRKVRLGMSGCPVFFFSLEDVKKLLVDSGWKCDRLERVGQLWFVVATHNGD